MSSSKPGVDELSRQSAFTIGGWRVDPPVHTINRGEVQKQVPAKVMAVLCYLAVNQNRPVTRDELIDAIWDGNDLVGDKAVTNAIWRIRQAFDDEPDMVRTVPKTGYQLQFTPEFEQPIEYDAGGPRSRRLNAWLLLVIIILAILGAYHWTSHDELPGLAPEILVGMPGREVYPAPSPDGQHIAFQSISLAGERDIFLQDLNGANGNARRVTFSEHDDVSPAWQGPGRLGFIRRNVGTGYCEIFLLNVATREEEQINTCFISENDFDTLSWSPDGRWLVHRFKPDGGAPGLYLWKVTARDGTFSVEQERRISCIDCEYVDQEVSWSPDSRKLAVTRRASRLSSDVFVYDLGKDSFTKLTSNERSIKGHAWYRDNRRLLYVSNHGPSNRSMRVVDTTGGKNSRLGLSDSGFPVFLPDYSRLVFYRRVTDTHISAVRLKQEPGPTWVPSPVIQTVHAERSPAVDTVNRRLAFISDASGHEEIWLAGLDGSGLRQLTDLKGRLEDPAWSPDGSALVFVSTLDGEESDRLRFIEVESGQVRTLKVDISDFGAPSWSADGASIIVPVRQHGEFNLWRLSVDGASRERLTHAGGEFGREDPGGSHVYFTRPDTPGFFRLLETGEVDQVDANWDSRYGWANWDWISDRELVASEVREDQIVLFRLDVLDGNRSAVFALPLRTIHRHGHLSYSPHESAVFFTFRELPQIDIWVVENPLSRH